MSNTVGRVVPTDIRRGMVISPENGHFISFFGADHKKQLDLYSGHYLAIPKETSYLQVFETNSTVPVRTVFFL